MSNLSFLARLKLNSDNSPSWIEYVVSVNLAFSGTSVKTLELLTFLSSNFWSSCLVKFETGLSISAVLSTLPNPTWNLLTLCGFFVSF